MKVRVEVQKKVGKSNKDSNVAACEENNAGSKNIACVRSFACVQMQGTACWKNATYVHCDACAKRIARSQSGDIVRNITYCSTCSHSFAASKAHSISIASFQSAAYANR